MMNAGVRAGRRNIGTRASLAGVSLLSLTVWSDAKGSWEHPGQPISFETSENKGFRALFPDLVGK